MRGKIIHKKIKHLFCGHCLPALTHQALQLYESFPSSTLQRRNMNGAIFEVYLSVRIKIFA